MQRVLHWNIVCWEGGKEKFPPKKRLRRKECQTGMKKNSLRDIQGEGVGDAQPPSHREMTWGFLLQLVFCQKKSFKFVYFTSQLRHFLVVHPLLGKILDPALKSVN